MTVTINLGRKARSRINWGECRQVLEAIFPGVNQTLNERLEFLVQNGIEYSIEKLDRPPRVELFIQPANKDIISRYHGIRDRVWRSVVGTAKDFGLRPYIGGYMGVIFFLDGSKKRHMGKE